MLTEDDTEIRLQAVDPEGGAGVQTISITILPTEAPTANIISPLPAGVYYSDQITFEVLEDEEDDSDQHGHLDKRPGWRTRRRYRSEQHGTVDMDTSPKVNMRLNCMSNLRKSIPNPSSSTSGHPMAHRSAKLRHQPWVLLDHKTKTSILWLLCPM